MAGSAAAPAARCRNWRRGSFILNLPSHHSITSSAWASTDAGRSSTLAVLRLITSSYLVGACTRQVKRSHPHGVKHAFLHGGRLGRIGDALLHMACLGRATSFLSGILLARRLSILNAGRLRVLLALRHEALECGTRELLFGRFRFAARKRRS